MKTKPSKDGCLKICFNIANTGVEPLVCFLYSVLDSTYILAHERWVDACTSGNLGSVEKGELLEESLHVVLLCKRLVLHVVVVWVIFPTFLKSVIEVGLVFLSVRTFAIYDTIITQWLINVKSCKALLLGSSSLHS